MIRIIRNLSKCKINQFCLTSVHAVQFDCLRGPESILVSMIAREFVLYTFVHFNIVSSHLEESCKPEGSLDGILELKIAWLSVVGDGHHVHLQGVVLSHVETISLNI